MGGKDAAELCEDEELHKEVLLIYVYFFIHVLLKNDSVSVGSWHNKPCSFFGKFIGNSVA